MNVEVEEKWQVAKNNLLQMIGNQQPVSCLISGWEPVDLETGLRWLQSSIYEGFMVDFIVRQSISGSTITFAISEPNGE
ncbi:MAG: hypothetical protein V4525_08390 [Pseudomonadota bacterium]